MVEENPTAVQFEAFRSAYEYFNRELFDGALRPVFLNFSRAANSRGFFAPERWERAGQTSHEISLNPSFLRSRAPRAVLSTLVHEMVHCWQEEYGEPGRGNYHNQQWADKMESLGLMPSSTGAPGGKRTGDSMTHYVIDGGAFDRAFHAMPGEYLLPWMCREDGTQPKKPRHPAKPRTASKVKYTCATCGANAWGRPALRLGCLECGVALVAGDATDGAIPANDEAREASAA